jgi:hypothetical protein
VLLAACYLLATSFCSVEKRFATAAQLAKPGHWPFSYLPLFIIRHLYLLFLPSVTYRYVSFVTFLTGFTVTTQLAKPILPLATKTLRLGLQATGRAVRGGGVWGSGLRV